MTRKQMALVAWVALPVVVVGLLIYAIAVSLDSRTSQREAFPPVGAGAGSTGGVNAIGEMIAGNAANHSAGPREAPTAAPGGGGAGATAAGAGEPRMVHPEELEQGFILIVHDAPKLASTSSPIFLAGTINGWNPGDARWKLEAQSDQTWRIVVPAPANRRPIEFKFTRGSWDLEELTAEMTPVANRTLPKVDASRLAPGEMPRFEFTIPAWGDQRAEFVSRNASDPYRSVRATGTLRRLAVTGGVTSGPGGSGSMRELLVWLPPGYEDARNAQATYPVLYMHDGQNLFEKLPQVPAEWGMDETAQRLIEGGRMKPVIIVGIPHSGAMRRSEYLPVPALGAEVPARGDEHVAWLVGEVMPRVERAFRVRKGPDHTGVGGSSLGAVIALHAAAKHPDVFGLVLAESPSLTLGDAEVWRSWMDGLGAPPRRVYVGVGTAELGEGPEMAARNAAYVRAVEALDARYRAAGLGADRKLLIVEAGARHTESAWAGRLETALRFLFPTAADGTK